MKLSCRGRTISSLVYEQIGRSIVRNRLWRYKKPMTLVGSAIAAVAVATVIAAVGKRLLGSDS